MSEEELVRALSEEARLLADGVAGVLSRLRVSAGGTTVELEWHGVAQPTAAVAPPAENATPTPEQAVVVSPMVGTFYHAPTPGEPPFVAIGGVVERDTVIGLVEAMKLMNPITADQIGVVRDVLVPDGRSVEFEQPLLVLDPLPENGWRDR